MFFIGMAEPLRSPALCAITSFNVWLARTFRQRPSARRKARAAAQARVMSVCKRSGPRTRAGRPARGLYDRRSPKLRLPRRHAPFQYRANALPEKSATSAVIGPIFAKYLELSQ